MADHDFDLAELMRRASFLRRAGRFKEAASAYENVVRLQPKHADSWFNLGFVRRHDNQFEEALLAYAQALTLKVSRPEEVYLNRAAILADHLRREGEAEAELQSALACNPNFVPALLNLGNLKEDQGRRDEARGFYARALALEPSSAVALSRLAHVSDSTRLDDPLILRLQASVRQPGIARSDRGLLAFALGRHLDACGSYGDAMTAYDLANRESRADGLALGAAYDRRAHERFIDQIKQVFPLVNIQATGAKSPTIFICGMFRSGSTLVEQILSAHPHITSGGELAFLPGIVQRELSPFPERARLLTHEKLSALAEHYAGNVRKIFPHAQVLTDKRPDNFLYIGLIKALFPDAKIIHTFREPLDNCLSVYFLHLDHRMAYASDLADIGHYYRHYQGLMTHWKAHYGHDILDVGYDALVRDPRNDIQKILEFCGLDWNAQCLDFHRSSASVKTASVWQVREPLYQRSSGRWRNYAPHLDRLRAEL